MTQTQRILVIYTGGTIGMVPSDEGYIPVSGLADRLHAELGDALSLLPAFDVQEFAEPIDSSNVKPQDWRRLALVLQQHWDQYTGFVILHGTDTMAYTASALSYMLAGQDKAVVVTGSQIPLSQARSDALENFTTALTFAAQPAVAETCICFSGRLLRGSRARKVHSLGFAAFDTPNLPWLGQAGIDVVLNKALLRAAGQPQFVIPEFNANAVSMLYVHPGFSADLLRFAASQAGVKGIILQTYGVGNPPDADTELMQAIEDAVNAGLVVVNISQCAQGGVVQGAYATGAYLNRIGVQPGADLTPEACFTKLHWLFAQQLETSQVLQQFSQSIAGELGDS